jgi:hypothetical protein
MATVEMWTYTIDTPPTIDLTGFKVEAMDGDIGKVDEATNEVGSSFVVVDTGPWIFGKKVMIPAGVIRTSTRTRRRSSSNRDKDEIKNAPEFDEQTYRDQKYRDELGGYYGRGSKPVRRPALGQSSTDVVSEAPPRRGFVVLKAATLARVSWWMWLLVAGGVLLVLWTALVFWLYARVTAPTPARLRRSSPTASSSLARLMRDERVPRRSKSLLSPSPPTSRCRSI